MNDTQIKKWVQMIKADLSLKEISKEDLEDVLESKEDVLHLTILLSMARRENTDNLSEETIKERTGSIILNLGQEALRRLYMQDHKKAKFLGEKPLRKVDLEPELIDSRIFINSFAMKIREKTGIELSPEEALPIIKEVLRERDLK